MERGRVRTAQLRVYTAYKVLIKTVRLFAGIPRSVKNVDFSKMFASNIGRRVIYLLASRKLFEYYRANERNLSFKLTYFHCERNGCHDDLDMSFMCL